MDSEKRPPERCPVKPLAIRPPATFGQQVPIAVCTRVQITGCLRMLQQPGGIAGEPQEAVSTGLMHAQRPRGRPADGAFSGSESLRPTRRPRGNVARLQPDFMDRTDFHSGQLMEPMPVAFSEMRPCVVDTTGAVPKIFSYRDADASTGKEAPDLVQSRSRCHLLP